MYIPNIPTSSTISSITGIPVEPPQPVEIVTRDMWGARPPSIEKQIKKPATKVFYLLTYTNVCRNRRKCGRALRRLQTIRMNMHKASDIDFNFMISGDGTVYEGRGWGIQPHLPKGYTRKADRSFALGYITYSDEKRGIDMHTAKYAMVDYGMEHGYIDPDYLIYELRPKNPFYPNYGDTPIF